MFPSGGLLEQTSTDHEQLTEKIRPCDVGIDKNILKQSILCKTYQPGAREQQKIVVSVFIARTSPEYEVTEHLDVSNTPARTLFCP